MTKSLFLPAIAVVALGVPRPCWASDDLLETVRSITSESDIDSFLAACKHRTSSELKTFVLSHHANSSNKVRLLVALSLSFATIDGDLAVPVNRLLSDDKGIRRVAAIQLVGAKGASDLLLKHRSSTDEVLRCACVLDLRKPDVVEGYLLDESVLVRSLAIRRLGAMLQEGALNKDALSAAIAVGISDHSSLVRTNALITSRSTLVIPDSISVAVVADARPAISVEELLAGERSSEQLRKSLTIEGDFFPSFFLMRRRLPSTITMDVVPLKFQQVMLPLDSRLLIGTLAGNINVQRDTKSGSEGVRQVVHSPFPNPALKGQLNKLLEQMDAPKTR